MYSRTIITVDSTLKNPHIVHIGGWKMEGQGPASLRKSTNFPDMATQQLGFGYPGGWIHTNKKKGNPRVHG